jgi:hypothetical protein
MREVFMHGDMPPAVPEISLTDFPDRDGFRPERGSQQT